MQSTGGRSTRALKPVSVALFMAAAALMAVGFAGPAQAADFSATAYVDVHSQFVGDATGTTFTLTVINTGSLNTIAAVLISKPSSKWTITSCPTAPQGWTAAIVKTSTDSGKCRFTSAAGTSDDIQVAATVPFQVRATNAAGTTDFAGNWTVAVSKNGSWGSTDAVNATATGSGLGTAASVWEITDAVVAAAPATVDTACPGPAKSADVSSNQTIVLCGRNHGNGALTPTAAQSTLGGTFIGTAGTFSSGSVAANTAAPVVIGNWAGTTVTGADGAGKTVVATTGSSATATSPSTTLSGYTAVSVVPNSAPVLANIEGPALAFTEGDAPKAVTASLTVTDADSANLVGAGVTISAGYQNGADVLALPSPPAGITPVFNAGAGTLTLSGTASVADYQAALRGVTYVNTSDNPTTATRTISFQVNDGAGLNNLSNVVGRDVALTAVNDAPVLANIEGGALSVSEGDPAKVVTTSITVADADSANLASATVAITGNYQNGQDVLALPSPPAGITPNFSAATGTLTLNGSASVADYQAALRAVTYQNTSVAPNTVTRTVSFTVDDGAPANHASNTVTRDITVASVNSAPVLANVEGGALAFTEGDAAKAITGSITVTDADNTTLASATVTISAGYQNGADVLALPSPPAGITPSFAAATGTLTLTGSASLADYQAALRGVTFANGSDSPSTTTRTISFQVDDGQASNNLSNTASRDINVSAVNDAPVLSNIEQNPLAFTEGDAPKVVSATIAVTDADTANLSSATVVISANYQNGGDVLALPSPPAGITPSFAAATGTLTLSGSASQADYQAALRAVTYQNTSATPTTANRTVSFTVDDGAVANHASNTLTRTITVAAVNSAPVLANVEGTPLGFTEGDAAKTITGSITVADADNANLASATVTIATGYQNGADVLALPTPPAGITPGFNAATGTLTLSGSASLANYQAALRGVTFGNGSDDPSTTTRTISFQANDGTASSTAVTRDITVTAVNDAPVLAGIEGTALTFTEGDAAKAITSSITVADADNANIAGATVAITANFASGQDVLALPSPPAGITPSFSGSTLTLSGSASKANYQTALRGVTFANASDSPSTATRTVSFQVNDGAAANNLSNTATRNITVVSVNDAPVLANVEGTALTYTENDPATAITGSITVADVDSANLTGATVSISNNFANGQDVLSFTNQLGISGSYSAGTGVMTLSGTTTLANYETALRAVKYSNSSDTPSTATRTVSFVVNDGAAANNLSAAVTRNITVVAVNDAPVLAGIEGTALTYTENDPATLVTGSITVADADSTNLTGATVSISNNLVNTEDALSFTNQLGITGSYNSTTGVMTLSGTTTLANYQTALRAVKYSNSSENPSSATRTVSFQVNDGAAANNLSNTVTRNIVVVPVNDNPTVAPETFTGAIGNTKFAVGVTGQTGPVVEVSGNVLSNDSDVDGPGPLTATLATPNPPGGRVVTMNTDGTFVYVPAPGFTGNDSFQYTVSDGAGGATNGTVTVTVQNVVIWYVNNALPTNGDGRSTAPFNTLTPLAGAGGTGDADSSGQTIFLYGSGTYTGGLPLEASQRLIGEPEGLVNIGSPPVTLIAANAGGTNPTITNSSGVGITLANDNVIRRVNVSGTSQQGISGGAITNADIGPNLTVSNSTGVAFSLNGAASGSVTMAGNITHSSGTARSVFVQNRTGGTVTISGAVNDTGAGIQLNTDTGTTINFTGGITSNTGANQSFTATGGGTVNVTGTNTLASTAGPALTVSGGSTIGASGLTFQSIDVNGGAGGVVLSGTGSAGGLTVTGTGAAGTGGTIQNTSGDGISLTNVGAAVSLTNMATSNVTGTDVLLDGGAANVTYAGTITNQSAKNRSVVVQNKTGGTVGFSGAITDNGSGILLNTNTGATVNFTGGLALSTGVNAAFTATGGGTVSVTGTNTITTTTGTALNVSNTTIGSSGLTFRSISAGTAASGPANGILLNSTGTSGGLTVTGTGSANSGGTIQKTTDSGIQATSTKNLNLSWMNIANNGNALNEGGVRLVNVTGSGQLTSSTVTGSYEDNVYINNTTGTLTSFNIQGPSCSVTNNNSSQGNTGISVLAAGTSTMTVTINNCSFSGNRTDTIHTDTADSSNLTATITNNTITGGSPNQGNIGIDVSSALTSTLTYDVENNKIGTDGVTTSPLLNHGINVFAGNNSTVSGKVLNNTIRKATTGAAEGLSGTGIRLFVQDSGTINSKVDGNVVSGIKNDYGIDATDNGSGTGASTGKLNVAVTNNNVSVESTAINSIHVRGRRDTTSCVRYSGNTATVGGGSIAAVHLSQANTAVVKFEIVPPPPLGALTDANAQAELASLNPGAVSAEAFSATGTGITGVAANSCTSIPT